MRRVVAASITATVLCGLAVPVSAADLDDLEEYLRDAAGAEFSGRQVVMTYWGDEAAAGIYEVTQSGGTTTIHAGDDTVIIGAGAFETRRGDDDHYQLVPEWTSWYIDDRYTIGDVERVQRIGRPATLVTVLEGDVVRLRLAFDVATGAPLLSETLDDDGDIYRMAAMLDLDDAPEPMPAYGSEESVAMPITGAVDLPATAGGYRLADVYGSPDTTVQAFYTDGLFAFSVFQVDGQADDGPFEDADRWDLGGRTYLVLTDPGGVQLFWRSPDASFVLVGDPPPDHLEEVLRDLPRPGRANFFTRLWRRLFG